MKPTVPPFVRPVLRHRTARRGAIGCLLLLALALSGCASDGGGVGGMVDKTLQAVGIKDKVPEAPPGERRVQVRLYPGENLNAANDRKPLALVVRIYHLRSAQRFEQVPYESFLDETREKSALGDDLIGVSEVVLQPGKQHELEERLSADAQVLGIVALFRAPSSNRWRFAFDGRHKTIKEGLTIGLHACAMTTTSAALITRLPDDPASLASVRCVPASR